MKFAAFKKNDKKGSKQISILKSLLKHRMEDRKTEFGEFVYLFIVISHRITSNVFIDARRTTVKQIIKNSS